jgi:hypothetical protein
MSARLTKTGLVSNILMMRPEICLLLEIRDPEWWEAVRISEEFRGLPQVEFGERTPGSFVKFVRLSESDGAILSDYEIMCQLYPDLSTHAPQSAAYYAGDMVPTGAAALWLGVDALRQSNMR